MRAAGDARTLIEPVRGAVRAVDPHQPVWQLWTARAARLEPRRVLRNE